MILRNPTKDSISVIIDGRPYTVAAGKEVELPNTAGKYWVERIHNFMEIVSSEEKAMTPAPKDENKDAPTTPEVTTDVVVEDDGSRVRKVVGAAVSKLRARQ